MKPRENALDTSPFGAGPYSWMPKALPLGSRERPHAWSNALLTVLVCWVPLVALAAIQGLAIGPDLRRSLLLDFAAYGRYLVAGPLFALAGSLYLPRIAFGIKHFVEAGLIAEHDRPKYDALIQSTRRLLTSRWTDATLIAVAYASTLALAPVLYPPEIATWVTPGAPGSRRLSLAGWWRALVSQPLFLALLGVWLWRVVLWGRFLWRVSRLDLQLIAGHPDRVCGLRFVTLTLRTFFILAFALGAMGAGSVAEGVLFDGRPIGYYAPFIAAQVLLVLAILVGPIIPLWPPVLEAQIRGTLEYGRLASLLGQEFEARWIAGKRPVSQDALDVQDFSATTDLYSIVANVRDINVFLFDARTIIALVVATLLPYVPLVFVLLPMDELIRIALGAII